MAELTTLIRSAYQQLADMGFRYWGTWQGENDTLVRCSEGRCLVAESEGRLVGTVTVKLAHEKGDPEWYRRDGVWVVTQFAVAPEKQGAGLGSSLMIEAERLIFAAGGTEAAIDTAVGAKHLVDYYKKRGYRQVGTVDWEGTNYLSLIMSKRLRPTLYTARLVLRDLVSADLPSVQEYWADERFAAAYPPGRLTPEHCVETLEEALVALAQYPRPGYYWAVTLGGETIGRVRLTLERSRVGQLGYEISADHWGKGFATEAVAEVLRYAFGELRHHRVQAWVYANNAASQRVLTKLGFTYEGALRERVAWGDSRMDDLVFGLLAAECQRR